MDEYTRRNKMKEDVLETNINDKVNKKQLERKKRINLETGVNKMKQGWLKIKRNYINSAIQNEFRKQEKDNLKIDENASL